jgi:hypothetical protein
MKTYRAEDVPEEFLEAIRTEIGYGDMTDEQQRIVDAGQRDRRPVPRRTEQG